MDFGGKADKRHFDRAEKVKVQGAKSECTGSLPQVNDQARISQATKQFACYATVSLYLLTTL
ncbi:hypothetical protein [Porphyromonas pogonae]|uniref:hypothetical protein n=1 Tax=Porphyromonas pogonae TaxID=867595 RepID=UPI002E7A95D8|nr:hypothetical protein [Porphyromonas pogonae]